MTGSAITLILSGIIFLLFIALTLAGAFIATFDKRLIRSVSGLALCFVGQAGLYYFLHSPFLSLMQIVIYVGAICIMIMFTMMLASISEGNRIRPWGPIVTGLPVAGALLLAIGLLALIGTIPLPALPRAGSAVTVQEIGRDLLNAHGLAFELISGVLLVAILGAILLARSGRRKR